MLWYMERFTDAEHREEYGMRSDGALYYRKSWCINKTWRNNGWQLAGVQVDPAPRYEALTTEGFKIYFTREDKRKRPTIPKGGFK